MSVTNNAGNIIQVRTESLNLVLSDRGANPVSRFVRQALSNEGVVTLAIDDESGEPLVSVDRSEAPFFGAVSGEAIVSDNTNKMVVSLVSPVFQEGNKWRFSDGGGTFSAAIEDVNFLAKVESGNERFGKGDLLEVDMKVVQKRAGLKVQIERTVLIVHRHITPHEQASLLSSGP